MNQETENVVSGIFKTMNRVYVPALQVCKAWGDINPPNPRSQDIIKTYISKIMLFIDYLESKLFKIKRKMGSYKKFRQKVFSPYLL